MFFIPECDTINIDYCRDPGSRLQRFFLIRTRSEDIGVAFHKPLS